MRSDETEAVTTEVSEAVSVMRTIVLCGILFFGNRKVSVVMTMTLLLTLSRLVRKFVIVLIVSTVMRSSTGCGLRMGGWSELDVWPEGRFDVLLCDVIGWCVCDCGVDCNG